LAENGSVLDKVSSYAGFCSVGKECDEDGNWQFTLNGEKIFHSGPSIRVGGPAVFCCPLPTKPLFGKWTTFDERWA
jgi:hypothetical protein